MAELVELAIEDEHWQDTEIGVLAEAACRQTLVHLAMDPDVFEIAILACDDARIAGLNAEFREKPQPTNVLSWPAADLAADQPGQAPQRPEPSGGPFADELGDIAITYGVCKAEAEAQDKVFSDHITHLLVHGCLHLLGYDHINDPDAALMEHLEVEILEKMGIANPY